MEEAFAKIAEIRESAIEGNVQLAVPKRRAGAPKGNRNRLVHGRRSKTRKAEQAAFRQALATARAAAASGHACIAATTAARM